MVEKISDYIWKVEQKDGMRVPAYIYSDDSLIEDINEDKAIQQISNVARLPGILKAAYAMPDAHQGYGFPIGGVAGFDLDEGVISPGGVGYDINCSVRLLKTNLFIDDLKGKEDDVLNVLFTAVPSGVGVKGRISLTEEDLKDVLEKGAGWAVENGYGFKEDLEHIEDFGCLKGADSKDVSQRAIARGRPQLGSLGAGNHFLEVQKVDEIFDVRTAERFGLKQNQIVIMIHCGSRGLGHQVASDYIKAMEKEYGFPDFDRELVYAPIKSDLGKRYFSAMACAANFAFANKQLITHWVREAMKSIYPEFEAGVVYDVCHNIAKFEKHFIEGKEKEILVMRKGATRCFGPGRAELSEDYMDIGQPVILPGSMGASSYVLVGTEKSEALSLGSTAHGAGRVMSRSKAKRSLDVGDIKCNLKQKGVRVKAGSDKGILEEAPDVYKDIDSVVRVSDSLGLARMVVRVSPLLVVKG